MRFLRLPLAALVLAVLAGAAAPRSAPPTPVLAPVLAPLHTRLVKSIPAKDTTLTESPAALQLWFSEKIELPISKVQLVGPGNRVVPTANITRDDTKPDAPVVALLVTELAAGTYVVNWTAGSADGHAVKGAYRFTVKTP
jgi:methionine-rich copper-binding protein CopC